MKVRIFTAVVLAGLLLLGPAVARADYGYLKVTNWWMSSPSYVSLNGISVVDGGITNQSFAAGAFTGLFGPNANMSGATPVGRIYCLDVYHTFSFNTVYDVDRVTVPPDYLPPPWNTQDAAWIYHNYGKTAADAAAGAAAQLALWEVSHDYNWFANWGSGWSTSGNFLYAGTQTGVKIVATNILQALYNVKLAGPVTSRQCYLYDPVLTPPPNQGSQGQGHIGDVPEPTSLVLIGGVLLAAAGLGLRKRR